jgi:carboxyl-terminal processing protease
MKSLATARRLPALLLGLALSACGGSGGSNESGGDCSIPAQNQAVYNTMQQWYLWYQELPAVDPASFSSPQALLDALTFKPLDRFSYLTTRAEEEALFGSSQFVGLGFRSSLVDGAQRVADVFEGGPAAGAGLVRGSRILAVDGVPIDTVLASPGGFTGALGPAEAGFEVALTFSNPDGQEFTRTLAKAVVTIPPVTATRIFDVDGETTGYLVFRNFVDPGIPALDAAFAQFEAAGVTQLIVDLRYNGGGLVSVVEHFANLVASRTAPGLEFMSYRYNDKNSNRDRSFFFATEPPAGALQLDKLVFITTPSTASASELMVNGLAPYLTTATVGRETFGKPVGQLGFAFCEKVLRPVSFQSFNALGEGDFFDGIPADCPAGDSLDVPFGSLGESSFDAAVHWLRFGFCPPAAESPPTEMMRKPILEQPRWQLNDAH